MIDMITHHALRMTSQGAIATAAINGAPILVDATGEGLTAITPVNQWIKGGRNSLDIFIGEKPHVEGVEPAPPVYAKMNVYTVVAGSDTSDVDRELVVFEQKSGEDQPALPVLRSLPFEVSEPPPCKVWSEADDVTELADSDKVAMTAVINKLNAAIKDRKLDSVLDLLNYKIKDCALSNGQVPERMKEVIGSQFRTLMFSESELAISLRNAGELAFNIVGDGKMVWAYQSLKEPAVVVKTPRARYTIPVFFSKIKGTWTIVR